MKVEKSSLTIEQQLFNKVMKHLHKQGLDYPCLLDPVAKTMCALGYLYSNVYSRRKLENLIEHTHICDLDQTIATREVVKDLNKKFPSVSPAFFHSLANMHDSAIEHQLSLDKMAEVFALSWHLEYTPYVQPTELKFKEKELPEEEQQGTDYEDNLPWAA